MKRIGTILLIFVLAFGTGFVPARIYAEGETTESATAKETAKETEKETDKESDKPTESESAAETTKENDKESETSARETENEPEVTTEETSVEETTEAGEPMESYIRTAEDGTLDQEAFLYRPVKLKTSASTTIQLDKAYGSFTAKVNVKKGSRKFNTTLYIYGDKKLLYSYTMTSGSVPLKVSINISGAKTLKIVLEDNKECEGSTYYSISNIKLSKKKISEKTSTGSPLAGHYTALVAKTGEWGKLSGFADTLQTSMSRVIPGLSMTNLGGNQFCDTMVPQGLTVMGEYLLVSAYCNSKEPFHQANHKSVIYVIDNNSGKYLKTLVLNHKLHTGGLAYDGQNVYVADSRGGSAGGYKVLKIPESDIREAIMKKGDAASVKASTAFKTNQDRPSFIFYYKERMWVGWYNNANHDLSYLVPYTMTGERLDKEKVPLPLRSQGAFIAEVDGQEYLLVSSSAGCKKPSKLYVYRMNRNSEGGWDLAGFDDGSEAYWLIPSMSEDVAIAGDNLYIGFESGAAHYRKRTSYSVDRVVVSRVRELVSLVAQDKIGELPTFTREEDEWANALSFESMMHPKIHIHRYEKALDYEADQYDDEDEMTDE